MGLSLPRRAFKKKMSNKRAEFKERRDRIIGGKLDIAIEINLDL